MPISNHDFRGICLHVCDTEICKNAKYEDIEKDIEIMKKHTYKISDKCHESCDGYDHTVSSMKERFSRVFEIRSITYGIDNRDVYSFKLVMLKSVNNNGIKMIDIVHKMIAEVSVNREIEDIDCNMKIIT